MICNKCNRHYFTTSFESGCGCEPPDPCQEQCNDPCNNINGGVDGNGSGTIPGSTDCDFFVYTDCVISSAELPYIGTGEGDFLTDILIIIDELLRKALIPPAPLVLANFPGGEGVFAKHDPILDVYYFKPLYSSDGSVSILSTDTTINIQVDPNRIVDIIQANRAGVVNDGTGAEVYKSFDPATQDYHIRSIVGDNTVTISQGTDEIDVSVNEDWVVSVIEANCCSETQSPCDSTIEVTSVVSSPPVETVHDLIAPWSTAEAAQHENVAYYVNKGATPSYYPFPGLKAHVDTFTVWKSFDDINCTSGNVENSNTYLNYFFQKASLTGGKQYYIASLGDNYFSVEVNAIEIFSLITSAGQGNFKYLHLIGVPTSAFNDGQNLLTVHAYNDSLKNVTCFEAYVATPTEMEAALSSGDIAQLKQYAVFNSSELFCTPNIEYSCLDGGEYVNGVCESSVVTTIVSINESVTYDVYVDAALGESWEFVIDGVVKASGVGPANPTIVETYSVVGEREAKVYVYDTEGVLKCITSKSIDVLSDGVSSGGSGGSGGCDCPATTVLGYSVNKVERSGLASTVLPDEPVAILAVTYGGVFLSQSRGDYTVDGQTVTVNVDPVEATDVLQVIYSTATETTDTIYKEETLNSASITLARSTSEILMVSIGGAAIPEAYYSISGNTVTVDTVSTGVTVDADTMLLVLYKAGSASVAPVVTETVTFTTSAILTQAQVQSKISGANITIFETEQNVMRFGTDGMYNLVANAFKGDATVVGMNLPKVTSIGADALSGLTNLSNFVAPELLSIGTGGLAMSPKLDSLSLPKLTSLGDNALQGVTALTTFISDALATMGSSAFMNCSNLSSLSFPVLTTVGDNAFAGMGLLGDITLPLATSIGNGGFSGCINLLNIELPSILGLGATAGDDGVFNSITGNIMYLTIPTGFMDGDITSLQSSNTVNITYV